MWKALIVATLLAGPAWAHPLIDAARGQIGVTTVYDPAYVTLEFPMGDLDRGRGVCTDVVIRALRDAYGFDLQAEVNKDMEDGAKAGVSGTPAFFINGIMLSGAQPFSEFKAIIDRELADKG